MLRTLSLFTLSMSFLLLAPCETFAGPEDPAQVPTIFVAPLSNNTSHEGYQDVADALTGLVTVLLAQNPQVVVVEREKLDQVLAEQALTLVGLTDPRTRLRVGRLLGADRLVSGGLMAEPVPGDAGITLRATCQVWRVEGGELIGSASASAPPDQIMDLGLELMRDLGKALQVELAPIDADVLDENPVAGLHYLRGLGFFYAANYDQALMEFFTTTGLDPLHDRAAFARAQCYIELKEYDHVIIELREFLQVHADSASVSQAKSLLKQYEPYWQEHVHELKADVPEQAQEVTFSQEPVFDGNSDSRPVIALLPTADFTKRFEVEPFARLIRERIGVEVRVLSSDDAPTVKPLAGHSLIEQAESLLQSVRKQQPDVDGLLVLTEAALETNLEDRIPSERWPDEATPSVMVASCLWLHMSPPPDLRLVNPYAPELPEHPEFYNFVLGCVAQLCGAPPCDTFGCPTHQDWYLWDQRYYKSWLCDRCRSKLLHDSATSPSKSTEDTGR